MEAARQAGFVQMTLLEEPQAAFYSWIAQHEQESWERLIPPGSSILVCDVGGGTTDFSLIEVVSAQGLYPFNGWRGGSSVARRGQHGLSVGPLSGGKLRDVELPVLEWLQLRHQARVGKEASIAMAGDATTFRIVIQGTGSSVVVGTVTIEISREEVHKCSWRAFLVNMHGKRPLKRLRSQPSTPGPALRRRTLITRHLACFLHPSQLKTLTLFFLTAGRLSLADSKRPLLHALARVVSGFSINLYPPPIWTWL